MVMYRVLHMIGPLSFDVSRLVTPLETSQSLYSASTSDVVHSVISLLVFSRIRCILLFPSTVLQHLKYLHAAMLIQDYRELYMLCVHIP